MLNSAPNDEKDLFEFEHDKRDRRISAVQRRNWADGLLTCLPDSKGYQLACSRAARLKEQALLNQIVDDWNRQLQQSQSI